MDNYDVKNIITIGASAGGISAVSELASGLKLELDAAVFVVIHISKNSLVEIIRQQIQKRTSLKCVVAADGDRIKKNVIYLAPPDRHMMLEKGKILVEKGAYDSHWRPSIDVLFRSAASTYDSCVTGIILTGLLDDGTSGMTAIKRSGGVCIIQDPEEAEFPDMPQNVLKAIKVDFKAPLYEIGYILSDLHSRKPCEVGTVPDEVKLEAEITKRLSSETIENFSQVDQSKELEESLWIAIRMMEERRNLLENMTSYNDAGRNERIFQLGKHLNRLKRLLLELGANKN
ncbi:chemotaxis protein CheB [Pedobacter antarcticus]|uniref:chemotaxis protein CheB n=1 Tax=Pedobacter antarcticus TaxID=34086 RepID=UPI000884B8A8|nr:chemotaxis protein CheB [Pedobacter antarcticus]SDL45633.1 CheB methylesterase [Pedobacter antarcticus]